MSFRWRDFTSALVNIYVYGSTTKNLDDQNLAIDFSSNLVHWRRYWFEIFNPMLETFHHHRADPDFSLVIVNGCTLNEASCLEHLLGVTLT